ncbi:hypothetical protein DFH09DRAFT_940617 [Mycena vulgaris]|nr:hypothetical protein DFH09DRAFT_940617 [Mycena vulgaris]
MTLKSLAELDPAKRSKWTYFGNKLLAKHDKKGSRVQTGSHKSIFLQNWSPKLNKLLFFLRDVLKCAKKYGMEFDTLNPSLELCMLLPLFHHHGENPVKRQIDNSAACKCLRKNHKVPTVSEGMAIMSRLDSPLHVPDAKCNCSPCIDDQLENRCKNPHRCATTVRDRLNQILPKWDPRLPDIPEEAPDKELDGIVTFSPPQKIDRLTDGMHIFTKSPSTADEIEANPPPALLVVLGREVVKATISGFSTRTGLADAQGGGGIWFSNGNPANAAIKLLPYVSQSKANAEILAALYCVQSVPRDVDLEIAAKSSTITNAMNRNLGKWEDSGWIGVADRAHIQALAASLRAR